MKKLNGSLVFVLILMTAIIMMASFGLYLGDTKPIVLSKALQGNTLFICPAESGIWDGISAGLSSMTRYFVIGLFFCLIILMFVWGYRLYQSLLKDKIEREDYKNVWGLTKLFFWGVIVIVLLLNTPNHYRGISVDGIKGYWVLCEETSPDARPEPSNKISIK